MRVPLCDDPELAQRLFLDKHCGADDKGDDDFEFAGKEPDTIASGFRNIDEVVEYLRDLLLCLARLEKDHTSRLNGVEK